MCIFNGAHYMRMIYRTISKSNFTNEEYDKIFIKYMGQNAIL